MELYPLKFTPIYKDKIWGGNRFSRILNRTDNQSISCGESWEISAVEDSISIVANGFLQGNSLQELIEIYMDELVGNKVYNTFGDEFPLLVKFLDTNDVLSVQVHPDNDIAKERHNAYGKTEMWYIVDAEPEAELIIGFAQDSSPQDFLKAIESHQLSNILHFQKIKNDEVFYLPSGTIHAIGKGILLAEIQQTSDITYRVYDWDRTDDQGNERELHIDLALDVINYKAENNYKTEYTSNKNATSELVSSPYFVTNLISCDSHIHKDYYHLDSFVILMCIEGNAHIDFGDTYSVSMEKGETVLLPAALHNIELSCTKPSKILEIYIP